MHRRNTSIIVQRIYVMTVITGNCANNTERYQL